MALAVLLVVMLAMVGASDGGWCVCKPDASSSDLQKAIDYACGTVANCGPILQNGACYNPNTVASHCSYAANSYYQKNNQNQQACVFGGTAQISTTDPSTPGCSYPATPSAASGSGGGGGTAPSTSPPTVPGTSPPTVPGTSPPTVPGTSPPAVPGTSPPTAPGSSLTPPPPGTGFTPGNGTALTPGTGTGTGTGTGGGFGSLGPTGSGFDSSDASGLVPPVEKLAALVLFSATAYLLRV